MNYFVFFLMFFVTCSLFTAITAYGIWLPQSPEELLEDSQVIFVGTITSVDKLELEQPVYNEDFPLILDEYTVSVEEYVKDTQIPETITVRQPTVSTPGRLLPYEGFEVGDRVLFYIESFDGINTYSKESFLIPKQCDTHSVITKPRMIGDDYTMMQNGVEKQDNFTANSPIQFTAKRDMGTLFGASLEYDVYISKQVGKTYKDIVLNQTITADSQPCEWLSVAEWEFVPDAGNYLLNGRVYKVMSNFSISNQFFSVLAKSPLKQSNSGVSFDEIQCNVDLILIQKYDGSSACVESKTIPKLIQRGWIDTDPREEADKNIPRFLCELYGGGFFDGTGECMNLESSDKCQMLGGQWDGKCMIPNYTGKGVETEPDPNPIPEPDCIDGKCTCPSAWIYSDVSKGCEVKRTMPPEPEPERSSDSEIQLTNARKSLQNAYQNHVNLGPYFMKDVIVGFGTYGDVLIVDIASKYTDSVSFKTVKQEIQHIVGKDVDVDYVVYDEPIERQIETVIPYLWNKILHQKNIDFAPKEMSYFNNGDGFMENDTVCSPLVASNGTEFFISSTFNLEPFEITGTFIDKTQPDNCHKIWKTDVLMVEPDRVTALWLENEN